MFQTTWPIYIVKKRASKCTNFPNVSDRKMLRRNQSLSLHQWQYPMYTHCQRRSHSTNCYLQRNLYSRNDSCTWEQRCCHMQHTWGISLSGQPGICSHAPRRNPGRVNVASSSITISQIRDQEHKRKAYFICSIGKGSLRHDEKCSSILSKTGCWSQITGIWNKPLQSMRCK